MGSIVPLSWPLFISSSDVEAPLTRSVDLGPCELAKKLVLVARGKLKSSSNVRGAEKNSKYVYFDTEPVRKLVSCIEGGPIFKKDLYLVKFINRTNFVPRTCT